MEHGRVLQGGALPEPGLKRLRVAFVGGAHRIERELVAIGGELGIDVEVHEGHVHGQTKARLVSVVSRSQVVFLITGTNSHGAVEIVKKEASRAGVRLEILKSCGCAKARALLAELVQRRAA
jgi:hypothetical protein